MRASTTDDNAAAGKIIGGFVSVIYFFVYQAGDADHERPVSEDDNAKVFLKWNEDIGVVVFSSDAAPLGN